MPKLVISFEWKGKNETADVLSNTNGPLNIFHVYFTNPLLTEKYGNLVVEKNNDYYTDITDKEHVVPVELIDRVCLALRDMAEVENSGNI